MTRLLPKLSTKTFVEIYESVNDFIYDYNNLGIPKTIEVANAMTLYYLLYGKYGNSSIANYDENQFKYKLFSVIFQYGPTWEKRLDIQDKLRKLTEADLLNGSTAIYNRALNPESTPTTQTKEELDYINEQNVQKRTKSKIQAYSELMALLETDVTAEFLSKFSICFKKFVQPGTFLYVTEEDEDDDEA